jgi:hypothetical protein
LAVIVPAGRRCVDTGHRCGCRLLKLRLGVGDGGLSGDHHLLKTFYTGSGGWADRQPPDGTVEWTAPSGHTYATTPGGSIFFPMLATSTGELTIARGIGPPNIGRALMMPRRKRTRAADRHYRITSERRINEERLAQELLAEKRRKHVACYKPPPY